MCIQFQKGRKKKKPASTKAWESLKGEQKESLYLVAGHSQLLLLAWLSGGDGEY